MLWNFFSSSGSYFSGFVLLYFSFLSARLFQNVLCGVWIVREKEGECFVHYVVLCAFLHICIEIGIEMLCWFFSFKFLSFVHCRRRCRRRCFFLLLFCLFIFLLFFFFSVLFHPISIQKSQFLKNFSFLFFSQMELTKKKKSKWKKEKKCNNFVKE